VNPDLEKLVELQKSDSEIRKLEQKCRQKEREIADLQKKVETAQAGQVAIQQELEERQKEHRHQERELEAKEATIKKYKNQLLTVKTNREYQTLQHEIEEEEKPKGEIEEKILQLLEVMDDLEAKRKDSKKQIKITEKEVAAEREEKQAELGQVQAQLKEKEGERSKLSQQIKPDLLAEYNKLLHKRGGLALVTTQDCTCQGCFINIPPQDYEELKRGNKIYYCSSCSRILYWRGTGATAR